MANVFDRFDNQPQQAQSGNVFDQFDAPKADPQIGNPQELTFAEKYISPLLEKTGLMQGAENVGLSKGGWGGRFFQGAADPGTAIVQMAANALPGDSGQNFNKTVQQNEQQYQQARAAEGSTGFDPMRMAGNVAVTLPIGGMGAAPAEGASLLRTVGSGALQGAGFGVLQPVTDGGDRFWSEKLKQGAAGAATGAGSAAAFSGLARLVSPNASVNPDLQLLKDQGVNPTVGQALGGWANSVEEKLQSVPILGDAIAWARGNARKDFNNAVINRSLEPIGEVVPGSGQQAIGHAGDRLSKAYDDALNGISHVNFVDPQFDQQFGTILQQSTGLVPPMRERFNAFLKDNVLGRMSPNGSMLPETYKAVDSELGQKAASYLSSSSASEQELGGVLMSLKDTLREQVGRFSPDTGAALDAADAGWANLVRAERAGKAARKTNGVFTPGQFLDATSAMDNSVRGRAVARGEALGQDLGNAGQNVLGNRVPDSGTIPRALMAGGVMTGGLAMPAIPLGLAAGAAAYLPPVQNALVAMLSKRPDAAPGVANYLRRLVRPVTGAVVAARGSQ